MFILQFFCLFFYFQQFFFKKLNLNHFFEKKSMICQKRDAVKKNRYIVEKFDEQ